ncbi:MAG: flagellar hook capping FlgD N-terminal domain-containing protein [Syntrophomonas sp.]
MMTTTIDGVTYETVLPWAKTTDSTASTTKTNNTSSSMDKDAFLKLLLTELKYQDPTNPVEDKEFMSQMASFSSLEQMQNLNSSFTKLSDNITSNLLPSLMLQQASGMVGNIVTYEDPAQKDSTEKLPLLTGQIESVVIKEGVPYYVIDGKEIAMGKISQLTSPNATVDETILNELLYLIMQQSGSLVGSEVTYEDPAQKDSEETLPLLTGRIESVVIKEGVPYYVIGGQEIAMGKISKINNPSGTTDQEVLNKILAQLQQLASHLIPGEDD